MGTFGAHRHFRNNRWWARNVPALPDSWKAGDGVVAQIVVAAAEPGDGEFMFGFSTTRVD